MLLDPLFHLQGIAYYHSGEPEEAKRLFRSAREKLKNIEVSVDSIAEVAAQGFTEREARIALRVSGGRVADAVVYATNKRKELKKVRHWMLTLVQAVTIFVRRWRRKLSLIIFSHIPYWREIDTTRGINLYSFVQLGITDYPDPSADSCRRTRAESEVQALR